MFGQPDSRNRRDKSEDIENRIVEDEDTPTSDIVTAVSRERLYKEVWSEPMTKVAARYGVSSSFLARVCTRMNVPRPERGYWAKLAVGKAPKQPPLPDAQPGDELVWSRDGESRRVPHPLPQPPEKAPARRHRPHSKRPITHRLLVGAREHFDVARETDDGYLKPQKKLLVDLIVSKESLIRGLTMVNDLLLALEDRGHRVVIAPHGESFTRAEVDPRQKEDKTQYYYPSLWRPFRPTVVYIGTVAIGLTVFELAESVEVRWVDGKYVPIDKLPATRSSRYAHASSWSHTRDLPSGRLCVQAFSPYQGTDWKRQWRESKAGDFPAKFAAIARELEREAATIAKLVEEAQHRAELGRQCWEEMQEKWRREEAERRRINAINDSGAELLEIIDAWGEAKRVEEFFEDAERRLDGLSDEDRARIRNRLKLARELLGGIDALERFKAWKAPEER